MNKIKKITLILFIWLLNLFLLSLLQCYPIPISLTTASFFQIPIYFWPVLIISPVLLYIIAKIFRNKFVLILCAMFYFFIFYSYGLHFIIHPTFSDIGGATLFQEYLPTITHIGAAEINTIGYLQFPVFFIFSKIFSSILGTSPVLTLNLGFFSLITLFPIFLILFNENRGNFSNTEKYFIIPALFLTLSYYFLNDQFVPQFLALIFLIILFGCYKKYRESNNYLFFVFIVIFYILTVFSHSFIFLFFLVAIIFEMIWIVYIEKKYSSVISYEMIIMLFLIPSVYLSVYIEEIKQVTIFGGSSRIIGYILSPTDASIRIYPLYHLVPEFIDQLFSFLSKGIVAGAFIIVLIGFLFYLLEKKGILDFGIIIGSFLWFIMGFFRLVLGERALQVAPLAVSSHFKHPYKIFSYLSKIIIVFILISPFLFISNTVINESIAGERLVQDNEENIACKFLESHNDDISDIVVAQNAYPVGITSGLRRMGSISILINITRFQLIDFLVMSPKFNLKLMYLNISLPRIAEKTVIYNTRNVEIFSL